MFLKHNSKYCDAKMTQSYDAKGSFNFAPLFIIFEAD